MSSQKSIALSGLIALGWPCALMGQWAVGVHGSAAYDHTWKAEAFGVGGRIEHRFTDSSEYVWRLRIDRTFLPATGAWNTWNDPMDQHVLGTITSTERYRQWSFTLDVKKPLSEVICADGYFRGSYVFAGAGWVNTRIKGQTVVDDHENGRIERLSFITSVGQWRALIGVGSQRSFRWGGLFAEVALQIGDDPASGRRFAIPAALGAQVGYRYVLARE